MGFGEDDLRREGSLLSQAAEDDGDDDDNIVRVSNGCVLPLSMEAVFGYRSI